MINKALRKLVEFPKFVIFFLLLVFGLFLNLDSQTRLKRRIKRDIKERGRTEEEVINRFNEMCEPMYKKFIYPSRKKANTVINSNQKSINEIINLINEFI